MMHALRVACVGVVLGMCSAGCKPIDLVPHGDIAGNWAGGIAGVDGQAGAAGNAGAASLAAVGGGTGAAGFGSQFFGSAGQGGIFGGAGQGGFGSTVPHARVTFALKGVQ